MFQAIKLKLTVVAFVILGGVMAAKTPILTVPSMDLEMKEYYDSLHPLYESHPDSARSFFTYWKRLQDKNVLNTMDEDRGMSVFTVSDQTFFEMIPMDISNPFMVDTGLQALLLKTQLVPRKVLPSEFESSTKVETVENSRTLVLGKKDGVMTVNDVPVLFHHETNKSSVYILKKILWIRPEDISSAIGNMEHESPFD